MPGDAELVAAVAGRPLRCLLVGTVDVEGSLCEEKETAEVWDGDLRTTKRSM